MVQIPRARVAVSLVGPSARGEHASRVATSSPLAIFNLVLKLATGFNTQALSQLLDFGAVLTAHFHTQAYVDGV